MIVADEEQRSVWRDGGTPLPTRVSEGVWAVAVPCPPYPVRYTYCYLIADGGAMLVVDPGLYTQQGWQILRAAIAQTGHSVADVEGVIVTHFHPDHTGMVRALVRASGCWVGAHTKEIALLREMQEVKDSRRLERDERWLNAAGVPQGERERFEIGSQSAALAGSIDLPGRELAHDELVMIGERALRVLHTPGHTPGHVCLLDEKHRVIFTGDHILPGISPNVALASVDDSDPLSDYLSALERLVPFDDCAVLPAHEYAFRGLAERAHGLVSHHHERADEIIAVLADGADHTPWQIAHAIRWSRPWSALNPLTARLALAETLAHLRRLKRVGAVEIDERDTWQIRRVRA